MKDVPSSSGVHADGNRTHERDSPIPVARRLTDVKFVAVLTAMNIDVRKGPRPSASSSASVADESSDCNMEGADPVPPGERCEVAFDRTSKVR
jgi:hypothetical protein